MGEGREDRDSSREDWHRDSRRHRDRSSREDWHGDSGRHRDSSSREDWHGDSGRHRDSTSREDRHRDSRRHRDSSSREDRHRDSRRHRHKDSRRHSEERSIVYVGQGHELPPAENLSGVSPRLVSAATCKSLLRALGLTKAYALAEEQGIAVWELIDESHEFPPPAREGKIHLFVEEQPDVHKEISPNLVPFSDVVRNFTLPFRGRDGLVRKVAETIDENFTIFASSGISREQALFITLEGLAGVGKTRFLLEIKERVGEALKGRTSALPELHRVGATAAVYITFNGSAVGHSSPHFLHPAFVAICKERGGYYSGRAFLRVSVVSQVLYGKPWGALPSALQNEILAGDDCVSVQKVSAHVRKGLAVVENQMVALYLLLDESQQLGREVREAGCDGEAFLEGMLSWLVTVMTSSAGNSIAKDCNIAFITLLAGTILPVGGKYGVTDWLKVNISVPPVDLNSAMEVLRMSITDNRFHEFRTQLEILLEDCGCFPRLIRFIYTAWIKGQGLELPASDFIAQLRTSVTMQLKPSVDRILEGNHDNVKQMIRLILTEMVMPRPPVGQMTREEEACFSGYVYSEEVEGSGLVYKSPMLLVHALGLRLGIPERVVALRPQPAVGDVLEDGFFDMLHAKLCVLDGQTRSLGEIFPGAVGEQNLVDTRVLVAARGDGVVQEKYQFYNPQLKRFYSPGDKQMTGADSRLYVHPTEAHPTGAGFVFKCKKGTASTDGRVFLIGVDGKVYELWFQLKGQEDRVSRDEAVKWARAANSPAKHVKGRKKVYVLCSRQGFSFQDTCEEGDVLLVDLVNFMPGFLRRCQPG